MKAFFQKLYKGTRTDFFKLVDQKLNSSQKLFVVTANPEAFMHGTENEAFRELLLSDATTVIADGIGIVKGAQMLGFHIKERIAGIDLAEHLIKSGNVLKKSIYLLGAKKDVLDILCKKLNTNYPDLNIVGSADGYCEDKDKVFEEIKRLAPDIVLVALGVPQQEKLIYKHLDSFSRGIFVGVGGSFDVLSGVKNRAPAFFIKHNIEWLYRIIKEPKRINRFYNNNIKFLFRVRKSV